MKLKDRTILSIKLSRNSVDNFMEKDVHFFVVFSVTRFDTFSRNLDSVLGPKGFHMKIL